MVEKLELDELRLMVERVFKPRREDRSLAIIVDLPDRRTPDHEAWRARREMAGEWARTLADRPAGVAYDTSLWLYRNVHTNNADLPAEAWKWETALLPADASALPDGQGRSFRDVLAHHRLVIAPTEFSATAPLKLLSKELGFRAATMPGFTGAMIPALRLDYTEIDRRVRALKGLLDEAIGARILLRIRSSGEAHELFLDLRHRSAHASGGLVPEPGTAGNLPSGEAYIVPYEGENEADPSRSHGTLPVELDGEVVVYEIRENNAVGVLTSGPISKREAEALRKEPAYGNLAELGLGILGDFGIEPIGELLLDEKIGLHIAFGRSDHFGGRIGAKDFSRPDAVIHIDRVYVPAMQPAIEVASVDLLEPDGDCALIREDRWVVRF